VHERARVLARRSRPAHRLMLRLVDVEKRKILLIDDSEITLAMEKAVLEARGYEVVATSTLMEFEKTLASWRPDLILTDIHMPEAKGTDICRTLKNEYGTQDIPIILFSSLPDDELSKLAEPSAPTCSASLDNSSSGRLE